MYHIFLLLYRYNKVRVPNNDDDCKVNPDDEEYEYQEENAKNY